VTDRAQARANEQSNQADARRIIVMRGLRSFAYGLLAVLLGVVLSRAGLSPAAIGTIVTVRDSDSGKEETYTILGAWDGDPERHIISYQTAIGQALMGHKVGDVVTLNKDEGAGTFEIVSISAAPIDQAPVEAADAATVDAVSA